MGRGSGGGGLRILPHKSWNVYGYDNRQKVKADEAAHAVVTAASEKAAREAEAEFRINRLRTQARKRNGQVQQEEDEESTTNGLEPEPSERADDDGGASADESTRKRARPAAAAAAAAPSRPLRFVVQQEDDPIDSAAESSAAAAAASSSSSAAAASPAVASTHHFSLFDKDVGSSQQSAQMERMKAQSARATELAHMKQHAPVSLFVEAFKEADGTSALRPWYAQSDEERAALELRVREQQKRQVRIRKRTDGRGGVQLLMNPTGEPVHSTIADPLDEMRSGLKALDAYHAKHDAQEERRQYELPPSSSSVAAEAEAAVAASSVLQEAIAQAKLQAASAAASSSAAAFASPSALHRSISTSSEHLPALQPMWSQAGLTSPPPPVDSISGGRRSRWGESLPPQADLHYSAAVGFTNAESALLPGAVTQSSAAMQPSLFAAAASHPVSRSRSPSSSSSSSSSSDSSSDSGHRRHKKHRSSKHRSRSRSRSRSRKHAHKHSKSSKHHRKSHRRDSSDDDESRSSSRKHSKKKHSKKHDRDRDRERDSHKSSKRRKRSRSPKPKRSEADVRSSAAASSTTAAPAAPAASPTGFKSTEDLRAERTARERTERERAAALLHVPVWAAAHPNSVHQRDLRDERPASDSFQGRPPSEFAFNRRSCM